MKSDPWRKSSDELKERFAAAVAGIDGLEQRKMFGYPAGFIGGNAPDSLTQPKVRRAATASCGGCRATGRAGN